MNILIVEDENLAAERIENLLMKYDPGIHVLEVLDTIEDSITFLKDRADDIDLVLLDIHLSDGSSFEIFNHVDYLKPIIFTTAYDQYSLRAFKVNSIDYLLKPVKYEELKAALDKYRKLENTGHPVPPLDLDALRSLVNSAEKPEYKKRFIVKFGSRIQYKPVEEIAYIFAEGKMAYIILKGGSKKYMIDHTLEELESKLLDPNDFFRINRKFILKIDTINDIKHYTNSRLEIKLNEVCEQQLIVSRERVQAFKHWLNK